MASTSRRRPSIAGAARRGAPLAALLVTLLVSLVTLVAASAAADGPAPATVSVAWQGLPLRTACAGLTPLVGRPVVLDRRVDPDTPVSLDLRAVPVAEALERLCAATGTGCAVLPSTIRVVPRGMAAGVVAEERQRRADIDALPPASRAVARRDAAWSWADGDTPRALVAAAADEARIALDGLDALPHDHLAAADLPPLPLAERLDLLLLPAGLRADWKGARQRDGRLRVPVVPVAGEAAGDGPALVAAAGAWDAPRAAPRRGPARPGAAPTWSLEVAAPLDRLLATVAARLELELRLDREGLRRRGIAADEIVRLSVENVDRDTLLDRIVEPLGLRWRIDGGTLHVDPPDGP
ncbi:MAG: hypothetical protein ACKO5R_14775 [Planctomycetaceae bacterium]